MSKNGHKDAMRSKKRFYLGKKYQMWGGGGVENQTFGETGQLLITVFMAYLTII